MTVQRFQVFGWANPVEGGDGPFGGIFVKESDYDALAGQLLQAERDAARYRYLRDHNEGNSVEFEIVPDGLADGWDAAIDAAIAADSTRESTP